jgi:hypothetical protein
LLSKNTKVASYFDSIKTFTEIDLIPIESKQLNTPFYQSVRITKKKGITPNPISNDLKQINMKPNFTYTRSQITFLLLAFFMFAGMYSSSNYAELRC